MRKLNKLKKIVLVKLMILGFVALCSCSLNTIKYEDADKYKAGNAEFTCSFDSVEIDWSAGSVDIKYHDSDTVKIEETSNKEVDENMTVHYYTDGKTLHVKYQKSGKVNTYLNLQKNLTLTLPQTVSLEKLDIDTASADVKVEKTDAADIDINTASGNISGSFYNVKYFDLDAASGDATVEIDGAELVSLDTSSGDMNIQCSGYLKEINADAASGEITVSAAGVGKFSVDTSSGNVTLNSAEAVENVSVGTASGNVILSSDKKIENISVETASGDVTLRIPEDNGFTLDYDTASGDFMCELPTSKKDGRYTCGDGVCKYIVDTASGDLSVFEK